MVHLLQLMNQYQYIIINWSPWITLSFTLCIVHSMGFAKCKMSGIHHYSIRQNSFTALNSPCSPSRHPSLPPPLQPLATIAFFKTVSIALLFPECCVVAIIEHVVFSDWFLSLSNMHLRFLHVILWLGSSAGPFKNTCSYFIYIINLWGSYYNPHFKEFQSVCS